MSGLKNFPNASEFQEILSLMGFCWAGEGLCSVDARPIHFTEFVGNIWIPKLHFPAIVEHFKTDY